MSRKAFLRCLPRGVLLSVFLAGSSWLVADGEPIQKRGPSSPTPSAVDMFQAMKDGKIAVKFIPQDATQCRVFVENKTDKPLSVKLPAAFAGVPVLAQIGGPVGGIGGGGGRRSGNSGNNSGQNQSVGGGMMGGMGGGFMNIPPEKVLPVKVPIVCLEHGKKDPRPSVPYEIRPLESFTKKSGVKELLQMLGSGQVNQRAVQAAAWHLNNDLSWQELAGKVGKRHVTGARTPYFSRQEIQVGMTLASSARRLAEENKKTEKADSPGPSLQSKR
ncbi:MAG: hypothetical protein JXB10_12245 [Pirellulales bacterium]|nr:hypothetical protein [Pirellulales bacterium]